MTFLNPLLLCGAAAVAAPILIHLYMNRRIKPVVWAAMRFLRASVQKNRKRMELEDILLLILRCLLLLLLALALARPALRGAGNIGLGRGSETAVIVLDNSGSMGENSAGESRFDEAQQAAEQVIDSLGAGSSAAVLLFSDTVRAPIPEPTYDLGLARKIVRDARLSDRATDVQQALQEASDILHRHPGGDQRIYLFTDGQANGWKNFGGIEKLLRDPAIKASVVLIGPAGTDNLALSDLSLDTSIVSAGEPAQFNAEVSNFSSTEAKDVAVRLSVDGEPPSDEGAIASIPPGGSGRLTLFTKFRKPGFHAVTAQINADHLPTDDQRTMVVRARSEIHVLLVTADTGSEPADDPAFYLRNALTPVPASERGDYFIKTTTIRPAELDSSKLGNDCAAVIFADVPEISGPATDALLAFVNRGGGLAIFPGPKTNAAFYNEHFGKVGLLPAALGPLRGSAENHDSFFSLQAKGYDHPIASLWNDPGAGTLASAQFYCAFQLQPAGKAGDSRAILKYADGAPAAMECACGRGRVILFGSTANSAWNDLPLHPAYLPLVERTLGFILDHQNAHLNIPVGGVFEQVCDVDWTDKTALVTRPGAQNEAPALRRISMVNGEPILRFDETDNAGAYGVTINTDPPTLLKFATQANPVESNLDSLDPAQLDALNAVATVTHWQPETHTGATAIGGKIGAGSELWPILALLVLVAACAESLLAAYFSAAK